MRWQEKPLIVNQECFKYIQVKGTNLKKIGHERSLVIIANTIAVIRAVVSNPEDKKIMLLTGLLFTIFTGSNIEYTVIYSPTQCEG